MVQTRRTQDLILAARTLAYSENYSLTEGWDDNTLCTIANLGLQRLYNRLTEINDEAYCQQINMDTVALQQAYTLPIDVHMALRLIDVRYLYGTTEYQFIELVNSPLQDRYAYPGNLPQIYCIREGQILLSPMPSASRAKSLEINYQKRLRTLDIRRGIVAGFEQQISDTHTAIVSGTQTGVMTINVDAGGTIVGSDVVTFQDENGLIQTLTVASVVPNVSITFTTPVSVLDNTVINALPTAATIKVSYTANSQKDGNLRANGESVLGLTDYICLVDPYGNIIASQIQVEGYDQVSQTITCQLGYAFSASDLLNMNSAIQSGLPIYIVSGQYASTNSELDAWCEAALIEYMILRLLRLQSDAAETVNQMGAEAQVIDALVTQHRRIRPTVYRAEMMGSRRSQYYPYFTGRY